MKKNESLTDYFLSKVAVIGPISLMGIVINSNSTDLSIFHGLGRCDLKRIENSNDLNELSKYYMVWHTQNGVEPTNWWVSGSANWLFSEYVTGYISGSIINRDINSIFESFKRGLTANVEILVALDETINKGIIVDGTKRAVALCRIKNEDESALDFLFNSVYQINILKFSSKYCKILFPCDFLRLSVEMNETSESL
ncbi:MAG: hypothetical protein WED07_03220 [Candidatus Freyarchaeum deiterrae]